MNTAACLYLSVSVRVQLALMHGSSYNIIVVSVIQTLMYFDVCSSVSDRKCNA
jgi:hypothetical protein